VETLGLLLQTWHWGRHHVAKRRLTQAAATMNVLSKEPADCSEAGETLKAILLRTREKQK
jgi:hypothetical protein